MRLKELRLERGLSQSEVANAIKTSQRNIGRWENSENEPSSSFVMLLADFFGVTTDYLLGLEDDFGERAAKKTLPGLNAEEQKIIEDYRALSEAGKQLVKTTIKTFMETNESERRRTKYSPRT